MERSSDGPGLLSRYFRSSASSSPGPAPASAPSTPATFSIWATTRSSPFLLSSPPAASPKCPLPPERFLCPAKTRGLFFDILLHFYASGSHHLVRSKTVGCSSREATAKRQLQAGQRLVHP